jgi:signal transduction histidine kinase
MGVAITVTILILVAEILSFIEIRRLAVKMHKAEQRIETQAHEHLAAMETARTVNYFVAHECSKQLGTIGSRLNNMTQLPRDSADWAHQYEEAELAVGELRRQIGLVREWVQLEKPEVQKQSVSLGNVIDQVIMDVTPEAERAGVLVTTRKADRLPRIMGSKDSLVIAFKTLVINGIRYRRPEPGALVTISVTQEPHRVLFRVTDNGQGIAPVDLPYIFLPGRRSPKAAMANPSGQGLGLPIAKWIFEHHGGTIEVSSVPGEPTEFTVSLPCIQGESFQKPPTDLGQNLPESAKTRRP